VGGFDEGAKDLIRIFAVDGTDIDAFGQGVPGAGRAGGDAGAGFVVPLCGDMMRMPAFGRTPAYMQIDIDDKGNTVGLY
jgi:hypothetical protein